VEWSACLRSCRCRETCDITARMIKGEPFRVEDAEGWQRVGETTLFSHRYVRVEQTTFRTNDRDGEVTWVVSRRPAGAIVAPRLEDGRFLMIRQERVSRAAGPLGISGRPDRRSLLPG